MYSIELCALLCFGFLIFLTIFIGYRNTKKINVKLDKLEAIGHKYGKITTDTQQFLFKEATTFYQVKMEFLRKLEKINDDAWVHYEVQKQFNTGIKETVFSYRDYFQDMINIYKSNANKSGTNA